MYLQGLATNSSLTGSGKTYSGCMHGVSKRVHSVGHRGFVEKALTLLVTVYNSYEYHQRL